VGDLRSFVVRVLGSAKIGDRVNGVVEVVETGVRRPFTSAAELWAIVAGGKAPIRASKKHKKQRKKTPGVE
jgi:hypothetical protein